MEGVKVKFSDSYSAKKKRIQRLPTMMEGVIKGLTKKSILEIQKIFHDGIKKDTLGLERLAFNTIISKTKQGLPAPTKPLYGKGDTVGDRSYMNMLLVRETSRGYTLRPSNRMHWSRRLRLSDLFKIHEHGAVISFPNGGMARIPPRPALLLSYRRYMTKRAQEKKEQSKEVREAMRDHINKANSKKLKQFQQWQERENADRS